MSKVIGKRHVEFKSKDGNTVNYEEIHCTKPDINDPANLLTEVYRCSAAKAYGIEIGDNITPLYNRWGKIEELRKDE